MSGLNHAHQAVEQAAHQAGRVFVLCQGGFEGRGKAGGVHPTLIGQP